MLGTALEVRAGPRVSSTHLLGVYGIQLVLHSFRGHFRKYIRPRVGRARFCEVAGLQILRHLLDQHAETKGLADDLGTGERQMGQSARQCNSGRCQQPNSQTSERCVHCVEVKLLGMSLMVASYLSI